MVLFNCFFTPPHPIVNIIFTNLYTLKAVIFKNQIAFVPVSLNLLFDKTLHVFQIALNINLPRVIKKQFPSSFVHCFWTSEELS